ncbi:Proline-rich protein like [Melia azedarach]|uniref:Proline-rich protein like n=1 Tax=Melia azedarach TaxID=155640 RepID=A0ACC1X013_MELAZ|nr:Proline-rich protein like [Melia azedarach]
MASEEHEMSNGWPLGLEIMNARLRVMESSRAAPAPAPAVEPYSIHVRTISFSSFSSSNLDTESTASFFHDNSVSLGRLIGFKAGNGRSLYFQNAIRLEEHEKISLGGTGSDMSKGHGICIPLLLKMSRSKSKPRQ